MNVTESEKDLRCANLLCANSSHGWWGLKRPPQGIRLNDRRYCCLNCLETGLKRILKRFDPRTAHSQPMHYRRPLGLVMLARGIITQESLRSALRAQRDAGQSRIGELLCRMGAITEEQLTAALSLQWGCPVFPLDKSNKFLEWGTMVPLPLLRDAGIAIVYSQPRSPVHYIGFSQYIDHAVLRGLEAMLDLDAVPCVVMHSALESAQAQIEKLDRPPCRVIKGEYHPAAIAQAVRDEAESSGAVLLRMVGLAGYYWMRLQNNDQTTHLLFEVPPLYNSDEEAEDEVVI